MFAQEGIKVDEVAKELNEAQSAIGAGVDVKNFTIEALRSYGVVVSAKNSGLTTFDLKESPKALRESIGNIDRFSARFQLPIQDGEIYLSRTHPIVDGLAGFVLDTAIDPLTQSIARRSGVIITSQVQRRTTLLLLRLRYHIITRQAGQEMPLLAEDCQTVAFEGSPENAQWIDSEKIEQLINAIPEQNITPDRATSFLQRVIENYDKISSHLDKFAVEHGKALLESHRRVRDVSRAKGITYNVEPMLPPDVLGVYIYLPKTVGQ
jgi:hypothetical protein